MKKFNPSLRVDQEVEYFTSVHGKLVKRGETKPATCISCHGFHGIKAIKDSSSPVYPLNVAQTCGQCHADADYMRSYSIPIDQVEKYNNSVHAEALIKKQDLSAPTCNDCHGNHGAVPPGVNAVANVCGSCHSRQSDLFQKSPHKSPFEDAGLAACVTCHSNHEVHKPSDEMLGTEKKSVCINCHTEGDAGFQAAAKMREGIGQLVGHINAAESLLDRAAKAGMEVSQPKFKLRDAQDKLIHARVVIHSFSPDLTEDVVSQGIDVATKAHKAGQDALDEHQFRRKGLAVSLIIIFFAVLAIYLKIRQIENNQTEKQ
jgi:predicted CXXCH cytochrome family protein